MDGKASLTEVVQMVFPGVRFKLLDWTPKVLSGNAPQVQAQSLVLRWQGQLLGLALLPLPATWQLHTQQNYSWLPCPARNPEAQQIIKPLLACLGVVHRTLHSLHLGSLVRLSAGTNDACWAASCKAMPVGSCLGGHQPQLLAPQQLGRVLHGVSKGIGKVEM